MKRLDLHKTRHEDVKRSVIRFVESNWQSGEEAVIITGHSRQMKELVGKVLEEYGLKYQIGDRIGWNTGLIIIDDL